MFHGFAGEDTGVVEVEPLTCPYRFEQKILLGHTDYGFHELEEKVIQPLEKIFISTVSLMQATPTTSSIITATTSPSPWPRNWEWGPVTPGAEFSGSPTV